jgi:hypothetical protein
MSRIAINLKKELGEELAKWYRNFGKVKPRRAYHEDDDRGTGRSELVFEGHPLLADLPLGAPSDLASILVADERTLAEAEKRLDESCPQLKKSLELQLGQKQQLTAAPTLQRS